MTEGRGHGLLRAERSTPDDTVQGACMLGTEMRPANVACRSVVRPKSLIQLVRLSMLRS